MTSMGKTNITTSKAFYCWMSNRTKWDVVEMHLMCGWRKFKVVASHTSN